MATRAPDTHLIGIIPKKGLTGDNSQQPLRAIRCWQEDRARGKSEFFNEFLLMVLWVPGGCGCILTKFGLKRTHLDLGSYQI